MVWKYLCISSMAVNWYESGWGFNSNHHEYSGNVDVEWWVGGLELAEFTFFCCIIWLCFCESNSSNSMETCSSSWPVDRRLWRSYYGIDVYDLKVKAVGRTCTHSAIRHMHRPWIEIWVNCELQHFEIATLLFLPGRIPTGLLKCGGLW